MFLDPNPLFITEIKLQRVSYFLVEERLVVKEVIRGKPT